MCHRFWMLGPLSRFHKVIDVKYALTLISMKHGCSSGQRKRKCYVNSLAYWPRAQNPMQGAF